MKKKNFLKATHEGELKIGDIIIPCFVLEGGRRVLSRRGVNAALAGSTGGGGTGETIGGRNLPRILGSKAILPHLSSELIAGLESACEFHPKKGRTAIGFDAMLLPMMCESILDAEKEGTLKNKYAATIASLLIRGFARVGITALVDEATGYQDVRKADALQKILDAFISKELAAWVKRFPDEFYNEMFRLKGWNWNSLKRPSVVGRYTNDLVYERLAPALVDELKKVNPRNEKGATKVRDHQWLTSDVGHPALSQHIHAVIGFMRASSNWEQFNRMMNRAFPKKGTTIEMFPDK